MATKTQVKEKAEATNDQVPAAFTPELRKALFELAQVERSMGLTQYDGLARAAWVKANYRAYALGAFRKGWDYGFDYLKLDAQIAAQVQ